jgi:hypothetical protein
MIKQHEVSKRLERNRRKIYLVIFQPSWDLVELLFTSQSQSI